MRCFVIPKKIITGRLDVLYHLTLLSEIEKSRFSTYRLDALVDTYTGGTPAKDNPSYWNGEIPWVSPKDFKNFYVDNTEDYITDLGLKESSTKLAAENSVLVVVRSGILQHTLPVAVNSSPVAFNQDVKALVPKNKQQISSRYLGYYLSIFSKRILPLITKHSTTVQSINTNEFDGLLIPLPDISVQDRIVDLMNQAYAEKHRLEQEADELFGSIDEYISDTLGVKLPNRETKKCLVIKRSDIEGRLDAEYYGSLAIPILKMLEKKYKLKPLMRIGKVFDGPFGSNLKNDEYVQKGIPLLRVQNIKNGMLSMDPDSVVFISKEKHKELKRSEVNAGDVVITKTGWLGNAAVIPSEIQVANIRADLAGVKLYNTNEILPEFLAAFIDSRIGKELCVQLTSGSTRARIVIENMRKIQIPIITIELQKKIARDIHERKQSVINCRSEAIQVLEHAKAEVESILFGEAG
jgi:restriction endonuclease S subunit